MESYVIRIYRRYESQPEQVVGLVEHPENGAVERFSGVAELVNILLAPPQGVATAASIALKKSNDSHQSDSKGPVAKLHKTLRFRGQ